MFGKYSAALLLIVLSLGACKKEQVSPVQPPPPKPEPVVEMHYTNLNGTQIKYNQAGMLLDVNRDGKVDLFFGVRLIGDFVNKVDKRQYIVNSSPYLAVPVNTVEQIPVLGLKERIPLDDFNGNYWYNGSEVVLMERSEFATGTITWGGNWLDVERKYLPFQFFENGVRYNGWVELTADKSGERLILHRMAISKMAEKEVKAGE